MNQCKSLGGREGERGRGRGEGEGERGKRGAGGGLRTRLIAFPSTVSYVITAHM